MAKSRENASHRFPEEVRGISEGQFEQLSKLVEQSGFSGEDAKIASEIITSKKEQYMGLGLEVPDRIKEDLSKVSELMEQWDDNVATVAKTLENDARLKPYTSEDLKAIIEMSKAEILESALESGNAHQAIEAGFVKSAEEQRAAKAESEESEIWEEKEKSEAQMKAEAVKEKAEAIAEPVTKVEKPLETTDEDWEKAMNFEDKDVGVEGGIVAINRYKQVTRPSLRRRIKEFFSGKKAEESEPEEERRAAK